MGAMFTSPARPFYQSVTLINLPPISVDKYAEFCLKHFERVSKHLDTLVVTELYERFNGITSYMQKVMNILFSMTGTGEICIPSMIDTAINDLLDFSADTYDALLYQMPEKQRIVFMAIAAEGKAKAISSGDFVRKYKLQSASSVSSAVKDYWKKTLLRMIKAFTRYMISSSNFGCKGISFNGFFLESYIHSINNLEMSRDAAGFAKYNYKTKVNTFNMVPTDKML